MSKGNYVLMLVYLDEDWLDLSGNKYHSEGFIEAKEFTNDIDLQNGLYGIMWGKTNYFPYEKIDKGHWAVVKTEINQELIKTDWHYNRYKFRNGFIVYLGSLRSAAKYILKHKDDPTEKLAEEAKWLQPEEITGSTEWFKEQKKNSYY